MAVVEELTIQYPTGFEHAVHLTKPEIEQHIRLMAALKMFESRCSEEFIEYLKQLAEEDV